MSVEKWLKYEILIKYDLSSSDEVKSQIKRYRKTEIDKLYKDISGEIRKVNHSNLFILKLVPKELRFKLKNYKIYGQRDLDAAVDNLRMYDEFEEVWQCKTKLNGEKNGIYGRFYINSGGKTEVSQYIEQVWADTARSLDDILINYGITYIRAERSEWGRRYHIKEINCKEKEKDTILCEFDQVVTQLEEKREKIERFAYDLYRLGVCSFDVEYKVENGRVMLIDWDTSHDKIVLRNLL